MPARPSTPRKARDRQKGPAQGRSSVARPSHLASIAESHWVAVAAVAIALAFRLWALHYQPWVTIDGTEYIRVAEALLTGHALPSIFPPGYPALIALAKLVIFDRVMAAAWVSVVLGALLPWPTWWLARRAIGARWAWLPTLAVTLHPWLVMYSAVTMSDVAYVTALYGALALAAAARPLLGGLSIGAAFAIRPEALLPAAALGMRELLALRRGWRPAPNESERPKDARAAPAASRRRPLAAGVIGFLLLAAPCWLFFRATLGEWTLTPKLAAAVRAPAPSWKADEPRLEVSDEEASYDAVGRLVRYGPAALRRFPVAALHYGRDLLKLWPIPLLALSLWGLAWRRGIESIPLLHLMLLPLVAISIQSRFLLGVLPALAILAAVPMVRLSSVPARGVLAAVWLGGAVWCGVALGPELKLPLEIFTETHKEAGEWLSGHSDPDALVMDRKPYLAFYARRPYRVMPDESYERLIEYAIEEHVRYMVVDEGVAKVFRPQLLPLLFDPKFRDREERLQMVYVGGHFKGYGIGIFRVLQPGEAKTDEPPYFNVHWMEDRIRRGLEGIGDDAGTQP